MTGGRCAAPPSASPSLGAHESQSRFWECIVGHGRPFWRHYLPLLQAAFPGKLDGRSLDSFYASLNAVAPSPIRTEADEVTYNLHIVLRFELELGLLRGDMRVGDLPAA